MEGTELNSILTIMDYVIFGHEVTTQKYVDSAVERRGVEPSYIKPFRLLTIIWVRFHRDLQEKFWLQDNLYLQNAYKAYQWWKKNKIPNDLTKTFFDGNLDSLNSEELYSQITEKVCYDLTKVGLLQGGSNQFYWLCINVNWDSLF